MAAIAARRLRTSVAPMVDVTDPCFLHLARLISPFGHHQLWTEMIHANAFSRGRIHQSPGRLAQKVPLRELQDHASNVVVQIGASAPDDAHTAVQELARLGVRHVNLNCGCPSRNVQMGSFGAVLMKSPALVADIVAAMCAAGKGSGCRVSVKCRIGVDEDESPAFLRLFLSAIMASVPSDADHLVDIVLHARRAWLQGLSPKQNRNVPVLNHSRVYEMAREFPHTSFIVNGGIDTVESVVEHLERADGVMIGRKIREDPWFLSAIDRHVHNVPESAIPSESAVLSQYAQFADEMHSMYGTRYSVLGRALAGFFQGRKGKAIRGHLSGAISKAKRTGTGTETDVAPAVQFSEVLYDAIHSAELEFRARERACAAEEKPTTSIEHESSQAAQAC
ncbi:hypothetical protein GGF46_001318 [Coemansia sp. RSA 552]|nr:hypothetical protein GGF46_001318 [Coemansia sp. RSA 552]